MDIVGGTSIGSMVGAVLAKDPYDMEHLEESSFSWFMVMCKQENTIFTFIILGNVLILV